MKLNNVIFQLVLFLSSSLFAQTGGEVLFSFLNVPTSPKQIALGGVTLTSRTDVSQTIWNPSSVNIEMENDISLNYTNYVSGINLGSISYAKSINPKYGTAFIGVQYLDYGSFDRTDASGPTVLGSFSATDVAFSLGYGYTHETVTVGGSLKYIYSNIDTFGASALLYDIGVTYIHETKPLIMSLVVRNTGDQLTTFIDTKETIRSNVIVGVEYSLEHVPIKFYGAIDELNNWNISEPNPSNSETNIDGTVTEETISWFKNASRHLSLGVELWPEKKFSLRGGYNHRKSQEYQLSEIRTLSGLSYGFGFNTKLLSFNYAFAKFQEGAKYSTFGLILHL